MMDTIQYISMYSERELYHLSREEKSKKVGIKVNGVVMQPPICRMCKGGAIEVDVGTVYLQCLDCGHTEEAKYISRI